MSGVTGFDCGTYNLVLCRRDKDGNFVYKKEVNAFIEVPLETDFVFNMMKKAGVPLIERRDAKVAYALGEAAINMAYTMNHELKRPMIHGCLNPKEKHAQQIMSIMIHSLIGDLENQNELLYYSTPANAINEETDADYHSKVLEAIFKGFEDNKGSKIKPYPINEGLALIYAELQEKNYTGMGISCLIPGTKIYTKRGIINIEDVQIGDEVITHKGRWQKVSNIVTKQFSGLATKLKIVGASQNFYDFVDNHELYVKRNNEWKWIGCEEIIEGDVVGEPIINNNREQSRPVINICERTTCSKKWIKKNVEVSSDVQRLIGYFLGDGSTSEAGHYIQFDFGKNELENIEDVRNILLKNFGKESSVIEKGNCRRVQCYSKGIFNWFKNHCYENKVKKYPWSIERINRSDCINLLCGLIRSDGCVGENNVAFYNTNTNLILLCKQLFSRIGIPASITHRDHVYGDRVIRGKLDEWSIQSGAKFAALGSLKEIINNINCENSRFVEKVFIEDGFCCSRIQKIEIYEYDGPVYDLQVENDHSFSGPFLTIHNCGAGMINICFSIFANPVFQFSLVNSGDWIDRQAAKATGETPTFINKEKTKIDFTKASDGLVERAIKAQYEIMMQKTVTGIKQGLEQTGNKARTDAPIDVVIAGGTSLPNGFEKVFADVLKQANLPIKLGNIIRPKDPLFSVARGALIAAEASVG